MQWVYKWFIQYYSQQQRHTDQFCKYYHCLRVFLFLANLSSILWIIAKFSFYPRPNLTVRFFFSVSKTFRSMQNEMAEFPAHSSKTWKHKWSERSMFHLKDLLVIHLFSFCFYYFYEQLEDYGFNGIWLMGWKPFRHKRQFTH